MEAQAFLEIPPWIPMGILAKENRRKDIRRLSEIPRGEIRLT